MAKSEELKEIVRGMPGFDAMKLRAQVAHCKRAIAIELGENASPEAFEEAERNAQPVEEIGVGKLEAEILPIESGGTQLRLVFSAIHDDGKEYHTVVAKRLDNWPAGLDYLREKGVEI